MFINTYAHNVFLNTTQDAKCTYAKCYYRAEIIWEPQQQLNTKRISMHDKLLPTVREGCL